MPGPRKSLLFLAIVLAVAIARPAAAEEFLETGDAPVSPDWCEERGEPAGPPACDQADADCAEQKKKQEDLAKKAASAYKPLFFNNDFSYLEDPAYNDWHLGESLKRLAPTCDSRLDLGGQYRLRYQDEHNIRGLGLTGRSDDFLLERTRLYANWQAGESVRLYVEYLDAISNFEQFNARIIEENRSDLLNAFGDVRLAECQDGAWWARVGRQELLYGVERIVSPLDWANTRRTFDGAKLFWQSEDFSLDFFWTKPVFPDPKNFDNPDNSQSFAGAWASVKGEDKQVWDLYFLRYAEDDGRPDFDFNNFGSRWYDESQGWLWEAQGNYQFGAYGDADVNAAAFTLGFGRRWEDAHWKPELWVYYDWASGDAVQGAGYNHMFPLAHKYLGYMDLYGRRNIQDLNFLLNLKPNDKLRLQAWFHILGLQTRADIPYNVVMGPSPATGAPLIPGGSKELGQEIDLALYYTISARSELLIGYSHFWSGDWFRTNPTPGLFQGDGDFFYTQWIVNF